VDKLGEQGSQRAGKAENVSELDKTDQTPGKPGREPIFMLPGAVLALCGLMLAIHLAQTLVLNPEGQNALLVWFAFVPFRIIDPAAFPAGIWPLFWTPITHAFLHASWEHVLFNTVWLAIFATPLARRYGTVPTLIIFVVSSVAGVVAFAATTLPNLQVLVGASGGVAGLTGATVRFMFQPVIVARHPETGEIVPLGRKLATLRELFAQSRSRFFILVWVILNAAVPLLPLLVGQSVGIAWQAHLGGFFAGLFLVPVFERRAR
jgi:membrane associated rhomboid family serine protease